MSMRSPAASRGPSPARRVEAARAQHRLDLEAAADRDVVAHAVVGRAQGELGSGRQVLDAVDRHRPAVTNIDHALCAGDRDHCRLMEAAR